MRDLLTSRRMGRRDFLKWSGVAVAPLVAGTGVSWAAAPATPAGAIRRGGTLVGAVNWTYPTMDPHISTMASRPGYDYTLQALSGVMSLTGDPDRAPGKAGISYVDHAGGLAAALGMPWRPLPGAEARSSRNS